MSVNDRRGTDHIRFLFIFLIVSNFQVIDVNNIFVHVSATSTKLSFTSIALAVVFIIRLFSTSTFRVANFELNLHSQNEQHFLVQGSQ